MKKVAGIFLCRDRGLPMLSVRAVRAIAGKGFEGDRYALGLGRYFGKPNLSDKTKSVRQVTLISLDGIQRANELLPLQNHYEPHETRRNLLVDGITSEELDDLVGKNFAIGSVEFRGFELCPPCLVPENLTGKRGFNDVFQNRGGIRAEILTSGQIRRGFPVILL